MFHLNRKFLLILGVDDVLPILGCEIRFPAVIDQKFVPVMSSTSCSLSELNYEETEITNSPEINGDLKYSGNRGLPSYNTK